MCRYVAYLGDPIRLEDLVYLPANSLIDQASEAMESTTRLNADGFGVGWYNPDVDPEPAVFKDITPAWNNANLRSLAGKVESGTILAHVRAARGHDPIARANCHPFQHGRLLWMHNGDIPGRGRLHRRVASMTDHELLARVTGNTDSELAFVLFRNLLEGPLAGVHDAADLSRAMRLTVQSIVDWQHESEDDRELALNFCVGDGRSLVATRYGSGGEYVPTLHYCTGTRYACDTSGTCRMIDDGGDGRCVIVSSEKLSDDPQWTDVEPGTMVVIREDLRVNVEPLGVRPGAAALAD